MKLFFILPLLLLPFLTLAQSNYHKGSVTIDTNKSISGYINYREWEENPKFIEFKNNLADKAVQKFYPGMVKSFSIDGMEKYCTYTGHISLNKIRFPNLSNALDTTTQYGSYFFKVVSSGNKLTLYDYTDSIKTRYFIQEQQNRPFELLYQEYFESGSAINSSQTYVGQLNYLIAKYMPGNTKLIERLGGNINNNFNHIEDIVNTINGNSSAMISGKRTKSNVRYFAGGGFNISKSGFDGDGYTSQNQNTTYTPKISFGADVFINPNVQKFILRGEIAFNYVSPNVSLNANGYSQTNYTYNQYTLIFTPQLIWNIYNKDDFKFYIDGGAGFNFYKYTNNRIVSNTTQLTLSDLQTVGVNFPLQTGVVFNKRVELFLTYVGTQNANFSINTQTYSLGVHFLFGNN